MHTVACPNHKTNIGKDELEYSGMAMYAHQHRPKHCGWRRDMMRGSTSGFDWPFAPLTGAYARLAAINGPFHGSFPT